MPVLDVIAAVHRYRERVRVQAQLARDIQHLGEVARMLFEDKPDKTKAVEAVNDIAAKRRALMDAEARALLDSALSIAGGNDRGDLLSWLMLVNRPGRFPYTQSIADPDESNDHCSNAANRSRMLRGVPSAERADTDPALHVAAALAEGWAWLAASAQSEQEVGSLGIEERASQIAFEFDEHRDTRHRTLARAARRLWAVSLREHFAISGEGLKLALIPTPGSKAVEDAETGLSDCITDQAEDDLLAELQRLNTSSARD